MRNLRLAMRQLAAAPGVSIPAALMLALGIGASTAIFTVIDGVLLRPLDFPESERLVVIRESNLTRSTDGAVAPGQFSTWQREARTFEKLAATRTGAYTLDSRGEPVRVNAEQVTAGYLRTLAVVPALGRDFAADEELPGRDAVAILSHGVWQRQFGGRPEAVNSKVQLDGRPVTIVGVLPASFRRGAQFDVLTPLALQPNEWSDHGNRHLNVIGRMKRNVTVEQASAELAVIARRLAAAHPRTNTARGARLIPMLEYTVGSVRPALLAASLAVGCLMLIAIVNVANLLLARVPLRRREIAVRVALGATSGTIVRQLLLESLVLVLFGGGLGILIAQWSTTALVALMPDALPRADEIVFSGRVLTFGCAVALLVGVSFGLAPALQSSAINPTETLNEAGRSAVSDSRGWRLRRVLVIGQLVIALTLLTGAGLVMRSFVRLLHVQPGFNPDDAVTVTFWLSPAKYGEWDARTSFVQQLMARLSALPGVSSAGATHVLPFSGYDFTNFFFIEGQPRPALHARPSTNYYAVTPDYFRAMQIPLVRGRYFTDADTLAGRRVVIINEAMAAKMFAGQDAIGKRLNVTNQPETVWREIVGIVRDVRHYALDADPTLQTYEPFAQQPFDNFTVVVRTSGNVTALDSAIRRVVHELDPSEAVAAARPLRELVSASVARQQFTVTLFAVFSGAALLLTAVGVYALMSFAVAQRRAELGIRLAVGAQRWDVLRLVLGEGLRLVGVGAVIGVASALGSGRLVQGLLFETDPQDPTTLFVVTALLIAVTMVACSIPAVRATRLDPVAALRKP